MLIPTRTSVNRHAAPRCLTLAVAVAVGCTSSTTTNVSGTGGSSAAGHPGSGGVGTGGGTAGTVGTGGAGAAGTAGGGGNAGSTGGGAGSGATGGVGEGAVYVAPNGDDSNPGTLAQPVRTLAKARDLARPRLASMTSDLAVYLRAGTYPVSSTVTFSNADSGQNGHYVKYLAYPGERPLITGGQPIKGWTVHDAAKNIYSVSGVTARFRQIYVNGVKAVRARSQNQGANGAPNFTQLSGYDSGAQTFQVPSTQVSTWNNLTKVEMHLMVLWADNVMRIASITSAGGTASIKVQSPENMIFGRPNPAFFPSQMRFYFENAYELLDQPGEWYLDETTNVL